MAKHWSTEMFVLCYSTEETNGTLRMRAKWSRDRNALAKYAAELPMSADPVLYNGFGSRLPLSVVDEEPKARPAKKKPAPKPKPKLTVVTA